MRNNFENGQKIGERLRHSPEVEALMQGKQPFVTRHGITVVAVVLILIGSVLLLTEGVTQQLMRELVNHTIEHIKLKL